MDNFEIKGEWFLPSDTDNRISGILYYDVVKGLYLELFGDFSGISPFQTYSSSEHNIILGLTTDSKEITLYKSFITNRSGMTLVQNQEAGKPFSRYLVNFVFEGAHFFTEDELKFDKLSTEIVDLDEWVGISGFNNDYNFEREIELQKKKEFELNYKLPEAINFKLSDELDGYFNFVMNTSDKHIFTKKITVSQKTLLTLKYKSEKDYSIILKDLFKFQNFLILALYEKTNTRNITLYNANLRKDYGKAGIVNRQIKLYSNTSSEFKNNVKQKHFMDMLFSYGTIRDSFPTIINNWYKLYDKLESSFNLLIEQFYNDKRFTENTFLNLAQSIESFHAHTRNKTKIPKSEYSEMKNDILSVVDVKYHTWLKEQFNFGNNLNLHSRLEEIIDFCSCDMIDKMIDKDNFIKDVKNSRNYYTHYSNTLKTKALKGKDLFYLSQKLKMILVCTFLLEIGFDKELLNKLIEDKKYKFFYDLIKE